MIYDDRYYKWLMSFIKSKTHSASNYKLLLKQLLSEDFDYIYPMDENRAIDGIDLRYDFILSKNVSELYFGSFIHEPCSILEMMIALAIRMERDIMVDEYPDDHTGEWFWDMICSLGLENCTDDNYDTNYICVVIDKFIERNNEPNGQGGLFTIDDPYNDIRDKEIWYQMMDYLNYILERKHE